MYRNRLALALGALAVVSLLQGAVAWWAVDTSVQHVQRGRIASDILAGFLELSASKQRLKSWLTQAVLGADADPGLRDRLRTDMDATLERLEALDSLAARLDGNLASGIAEHSQRREALDVLRRSLAELGVAVSGAHTLLPSVPAGTVWAEMTRVFDMSRGTDLRSLLAESISRERGAMVRERAAADGSLSFALAVSFGATALLAFAAAASGLYFARALRRPLQDLTTGAKALQDGRLQHRIPDTGNDEFSRFARSVNAMAGELQQHREREALQRHNLEELVESRTAELSQALYTLQQLDARRRRLFDDISHELRTPATAIRGEAEVALRGRDKPVEEYKAALRCIVSAVQQLGIVTDDLLTIARSEIEAFTMKRMLLDAGEPLADAVQQARALGRERGVHVSDPSGAVRSVHVLGDSNRLRQLFTLLLDNAVRYSNEDGVVSVSGSFTNSPGGAALWQVAIADHGIGIAGDELAHIFERSFRSERARAHSAEGSGLGLSLAVSLARWHDGDIQVESNEGRGTTVRLSLPRYLEKAAELA